MNIAQLQHFVALAETRSFSRASETVHVTQSALSRSIQML
ncbi:LysR family transcriptional regulator [Acidovorax sp.]|nr:LysR family transcriptional regulator [Acidovorax sp.]MDZ7867580.1 LysR family transcriptional regulator [Acidovorax sp.]